MEFNTEIGARRGILEITMTALLEMTAEMRAAMYSKITIWEAVILEDRGVVLYNATSELFRPVGPGEKTPLYFHTFEKVGDGADELMFECHEADVGGICEHGFSDGWCPYPSCLYANSTGVYDVEVETSALRAPPQPWDRCIVIKPMARIHRVPMGASWVWEFKCNLQPVINKFTGEVIEWREADDGVTAAIPVDPEPLVCPDKPPQTRLADPSGDLDECPVCGTLVVVPEKTLDGPQEGDTAMCFMCGTELVYGPGLRMELPPSCSRRGGCH
jgi:hypothetical protein